MNLYEIGVHGAIINNLLRENLGELTPEMEQQLDGLLLEGKDRIEAAAQVVRSLEASAQACADEAQRLTDRAKSFKGQVDYLKARMLFALDAAFNGKIKTPLFSIYGQTSAATVGFEVEPDADLALIAESDPDTVRRKFEPDKIALKARYDAGKPIPHGIALVENPGKRSLRIR